MARLAKMIVLLMAFSFVFTLVSYGGQSSDEMVKCPVSGKEIKKSEAKATYEYKGKTYYFCCENCKETFLENPDKYVPQESGSHEGHMHSAQQEEGMVVDPVCGMKLDKEKAAATYQFEGKTYYFCTEECKDKFAESPDQYVKNDGETVTCPVSGEEFDKSKAAGSYEYEGKTYYFCCDGCKEKFLKDPEKYIKKK